MDSSEALDEQSNLREIYEDISMNIQETRPLQQPAKAADPTDQLQELEADDDGVVELFGAWLICKDPNINPWTIHQQKYSTCNAKSDQLFPSPGRSSAVQISCAVDCPCHVCSQDKYRAAEPKP